MTRLRNDRHLSVHDLKRRIAENSIDTVVVAFTDMQGRLQGKRLHAAYFVDHVLEHGTEGCNYLLAVDIDMNTVSTATPSPRGTRATATWSSRSTSRRIRLLPHLPGTAMIQCDLLGLDHAPVPSSPRTILQQQLAGLAEARLRRVGRHRTRVHGLRTTAYEDAWKPTTAA